MREWIKAFSKKQLIVLNPNCPNDHRIVPTKFYDFNIDQQDSKGLSWENVLETTDFFPLAGSLENVQ